MDSGVGGAAAVGRASTIDRLTEDRFDLLVVGGGIVGAGVAWLAAAQGLRVALLDRADFGSATSSASSKLIHGGLRYLRMGDVRLVREALREERALVSTIAPHLVRPLPFLLPVYDDGPYGRAAIRSVLWLYRTLAGDGAFTRLLPAREAAAIVPSLRIDRLRGAGTYEDAQTNDARLCLAAVAAAAAENATVLNYAEVVALSFAGGEARAAVTDRLADESFEVAAAAVVNAAGPWIDHVRQLEHRGAGTSVTLSKGAHLLLPQPTPWRAALTIPLDRSRVSFAIPWEGVLMLGTTDDAFEGDPAAVSVAPEEERQILSEAARALPEELLRPDDVLARFAGLRVLPIARRGTAAARRETIVTRGPHGMVSVAGGKLTTFRQIAVSVLGAVGVPRPVLPALALPGAGHIGEIAAELQRRWPEVGDGTAALLARTYGTQAASVLDHAESEPDALARLVAGEPELVAQVAFARDREWAVTVDDVLRRRTTLALRGVDTPELRARIAAALGAPDPAVERA
jgi:glycerol-3-phosphate dehydrogenase